MSIIRASEKFQSAEFAYDIVSSANSYQLSLTRTNKPSIFTFVSHRRVHADKDT